jgi:endoglucanase
MNEQIAIPRWRGFNLTELGGWGKSPGDFQEDDFRWMADWGFDFARIPSSYKLWTAQDDLYKIDEAMVEKLDRVIQLGQKYGIHINFNFHHGPGYCVNVPIDEAFNLWQVQAALDAFVFHWEYFTERYKGITSERLSFNIINEPQQVSRLMSREDHERVIRTTVSAIRAIDPERLIFVDGLSWGNQILPELVDLNVVQSCRAYQPMNVSHYKAHWIPEYEGWQAPTWPGVMADGQLWNHARLVEHYAPWIELARQGTGVHCGEGGAYHFTPHEVVLTWLRDVLSILSGAGIGFALWNLRGNFGILDSGRPDVEYEDWYGCQLDRRLLNLLQEY